MRRAVRERTFCCNALDTGTVKNRRTIITAYHECCTGLLFGVPLSTSAKFCGGKNIVLPPRPPVSGGSLPPLPPRWRRPCFQDACAIRLKLNDIRQNKYDHTWAGNEIRNISYRASGLVDSLIFRP